MVELSDSRLRVVHLTRNIGVAAALNHGIQLAQGDYIARHDHDDISRPTRLEQQARFMQAHPECGLLGTRSEIWVADEPTERGHFHPLENPALQFALLFDNYFVHSSVLIRKRALEKVGLYSTDPLRQPPEDYELWSRIARQYEVRNLPEQLLIYREMPKSLSSSGREGAFSFLDKLVMISAENLAWRLGLPSPSHDCRDAAALIMPPMPRYRRMSISKRFVRWLSAQPARSNMIIPARSCAAKSPKPSTAFDINTPSGSKERAGRYSY